MSEVHPKPNKPDYYHYGSAAFVFFAAFITYALTVQQTISFWDCGEFIAASVTLGIPHPPGSPLFILLGRVFSIIPFVEDVAHRINYISVISSSFTAMFSYLLTEQLARSIFADEKTVDRWQHLTIRIGAIAGGLFVAFSFTNWANSVEAEVYGLALALMVLMTWLTFQYYEHRFTARGVKLMVMITFLALLGVGLHLSVYLVFPFFAIFFILKPEAGAKQLKLISLFVLFELLLIILLADGRGGLSAFYLVTTLLGAGLIFYLRQYIRWIIAISVIAFSSLIIGFSKFILITPSALVLILVLAFIAKKMGWSIRWKAAIMMLLIGLIGFSVHFYLPIRSAQAPRINENNPSSSYQALIDFLERKQYGQQSMIDRMFVRRGTLEHQFGRHAHMGFYSYFERQYSESGTTFLLFLALGLIGLVVAVRKRLELGLPFMTLFLICSVGLILYMNFADGTLYNAATGDAHMEVRERDYFFTPAFVFFGIAMGLGLTAIANYGLSLVAGRSRMIVATGSALMLLLPLVAFSANYDANDRSNNFLPRVFAENMLNNCGENAILFTIGDNETFPLWAVQEVYEHRPDVRVVNTSLLQGDWYIEQMKNIYNVPMSFSDEQILGVPTEVRPGVVVNRPAVKFADRPRGVQTYLAPYRLGERVVRVPEMVVDDIIIENAWEVPIYFSSMPSAASPLNLRSRIQSEGFLLRLMADPAAGAATERTYDLFMNQFDYTGFDDPTVRRDIGISRDFMITLGLGSIKLYGELINMGDTTRAIALAEKMITNYPEDWQFPAALAEIYRQKGDTAKALTILKQARAKLAEFAELNRSNFFYAQDVGLLDIEIGYLTGDENLISEGVKQMTTAFEQKPNDAQMFRKMVRTLSEQRRIEELQAVVEKFATYKRNLNDPTVRQLLGR